MVQGGARARLRAAASTLIPVLFLGARGGPARWPTRPPDDPEVQDRIRRILLFARIDVILLLAIVFVMTAKPLL